MEVNMKTQIKRFSKSAMAVVLSVCMLISCMTVGIIATDAAYPDSESVGDDVHYYLRGNINGTNHQGVPDGMKILYAFSPLLAIMMAMQTKNITSANVNVIEI